MLVNAYCTHRAPPALAFPHQLRNRRDRSDPELGKHLQGFMGFVMAGGKRKMTQTRFHVLSHLERVRHHLALEVDPRDMNAFAAWAREANALVFLADATVRAPDGAVLVAADTGDPQPGAEVPYPADAVRRKAATEARLATLGIRTPKSLPPVVAEVEVELREARDVATRSLALFACAVRAESLASKQPIPSEEIRRKVPHAFEAMSPKEHAFFAAETPPEQDVVNHVWRYEAITVLRWALDATGAARELTMPAGLCDVPALAKAMLDADEAFVTKARLRDAGEILDALDVSYRLHWAVTDARVKKVDPPEGLEPGVISERHHALNWLTRFQDAAWDDVDTPT